MGKSHETMIEYPDMSLVLARLDDIARRLDGQHVSPWMTTKEAAVFLRCSPRQIESLTTEGLLPYKRQDPTCRRSPRLYHRRHLTAYLVAGRNPVTQRLTPAEKREVEELLS